MRTILNNDTTKKTATQMEHNRLTYATPEASLGYKFQKTLRRTP